MSQFRLAHLGLVLAAIGFNITTSLVGVAPSAYATETLRPEVGKPLQASQDLMKAQKYKDAMAKVQEADGVAGKTPVESYNIERMRGIIASASGNHELAAKSFEAVIASGRLTDAEKPKFIQIVASSYYGSRDYTKAISWLSRYFKEGGDDPKFRSLLIQSYYLNNQFAVTYKELLADIQASEKAGRSPTEGDLNMLASCAFKLNDKNGYAVAIEKLVTFYPKKESWADLLNRVQAKPGYADRLALDVYRLKLAIGQMQAAKDFMEMAQLALQAGFPAEANKIIDSGFKSGVLGTGAEADVSRQKRLRDLAVKNSADDLKTMAQSETEASKSKEGTGLVNLGYAFVSTGQIDKGIGMMEQGIKVGGLKRPDDAKLHLGIAYTLGEKKAKAIQIFKTVQGGDGTADLARYWIMQLNHPMN